MSPRALAAFLAGIFFPLLALSFRIVLVEEDIHSSQVLGSFQNSYRVLEP
jgi:hypothetical protein